MCIDIIKDDLAHFWNLESYTHVFNTEARIFDHFLNFPIRAIGQTQPTIAFFEISGFGPVWIRLKLRASGQVGIHLLWVPN